MDTYKTRFGVAQIWLLIPGFKVDIYKTRFQRKKITTKIDLRNFSKFQFFEIPRYMYKILPVKKTGLYWIYKGQWWPIVQKLFSFFLFIFCYLFFLFTFSMSCIFSLLFTIVFHFLFHTLTCLPKLFLNTDRHFFWNHFQKSAPKTRFQSGHL